MSFININTLIRPVLPNNITNFIVMVDHKNGLFKLLIRIYHTGEFTDYPFISNVAFLCCILNKNIKKNCLHMYSYIKLTEDFRQISIIKDFEYYIKGNIPIARKGMPTICNYNIFPIIRKSFIPKPEIGVWHTYGKVPYEFHHEVMPVPVPVIIVYEPSPYVSKKNTEVLSYDPPKPLEYFPSERKIEQSTSSGPILLSAEHATNLINRKKVVKRRMNTYDHSGKKIKKY